MLKIRKLLLSTVASAVVNPFFCVPSALACSAQQSAALALWAARCGYIISQNDGGNIWMTCMHNDGYSLGTYSAPRVCENEAGAPKKPPENDEPAKKQCGSVIYPENQVLEERIPLVGVPFDLVYSSDRVTGRSEDYTIHVPLTNATVPSDLTSFDLTIEIAGRTITQNLTPTSPATAFSTWQVYNFTWDGLDNNGNPVIGSKPAVVKLVDNFSTARIGKIHAPWAQYLIGGWRTKSLGLGGWNLSIMHYYDVGAKTVRWGYGGKRSVNASVVGSEYRVESDDNSEVYMFDSNGRHDRTLYALTGVTKHQFNYNGSGQLTSVVDAFSNTTTISYVSGVATKITGPFGKETLLGFDTNGWLSEVILPSGTDKYEMTYHGTGGLLATFEDPENNSTGFTYDSFGQLTAEDGAGNSSYSLTKSRISDTRERVRVQTAVGRITDYTVTHEGTKYAPISVALASGGTSSYSQNAGGSTTRTHAGVTIAKLRNNDIRFGTGGSFRPNINRTIGWVALNTSVTQTVSYLSGTGPYNINEFKETYTTNSKATEIKYTGSTGLVTRKTPLARYEYTYINAKQQPTQSQWANLTPIDFTYDTIGRLTYLAQGVRSLDLTYNSSGWLSSVENALGQVTSYGYDSDGRLTSITLPDMRVISYTYDKNGNLKTVTPPSVPAHTFNYNADRNVSSYVPPALGASAVPTTYSYNNDKQLTGISRPDSQSLSLSYNSATGRLSAIATPAGNYSFSWDIARDGLSSVSSPDSITTTISYPPGNHPYISGISQNGAAAGSFTQSRNADLQVSQIVLRNGAGTSVSTRNLTYDNDSLLTAIGPLSITRNAATGFASTLTHSNIEEDLVYNSFGEVTGQDVDYLIGPAAVYDVTYTRDDLGRVSAKSETIGGTTTTYGFTYDTAGRLTDVMVNGSAYSNYTYDTNSNRTSRTISGVTVNATVDDQDRLLTHGTLSFTYNLNGELATKADSAPNPDETTSYVYDVMGNLKSVTLPNGNVISYVIDGLNQRVAKKVNGTSTRRWIYDEQGRVIGELDGSGNYRSHFLYGVKGHVPESMVTSSGAEYRLISDQLGSIRLVVKASDGTIAQRIDYDEFGRVTSDTNMGFQPFGFAGGLYDPDTKLVRFGARRNFGKVWTA
ncbi:MAG: hypothetical protein NDI61_05580 [Bdellovibrionaceae bacterium]|nr:hypothetical protein [Pseudobdellovibrionaceae bacterium]